MSRQSTLALALMLFVCAALALSVDDTRQSSTVAKPRTVPGVQADGAIMLHNQWSLRPAGKQVELGDFPVNLALHPSGAWLAALHAGFGAHEIIVVDLKRQKIMHRLILDQTFYGLTFSPDGRHLYASGGEYSVVHRFAFSDGLLWQPQRLPAAGSADKFVVGGVAVAPDGHTLYAAGTWGDAVCFVPIDAPTDRVSVAFEKNSYPYACLASPDGKRLFVSLWNRATVAVIDIGERKIITSYATEKHPTEMTLSPDGRTLFVACANSTKVSVLNTETGQGLETIACSLHAQAPPGNTPNSLCLTPDGQILFIANADANNIAVFNVAEPGKSKPLGFIPAGWYPTSVRYNAFDKRIYVANGRGTTPQANVQGPNPNLPANRTIRQYIASLYHGTLGIIDMPTPEQMAAYSKSAYTCSPLRADQGVVAVPLKDSPVPVKVGDPSPIKYVFYVIKENRTYDQVFGDMQEGNGDSHLCIFPEKVTPNHHRLARQFVLLDNFYVDGEVSADGHEWSMGAYATDFIEKVWPLTYRGSPLKKLNFYPSEGNFDAIARPAGGYIWDRCAEAGVSYRSYGEWVANAKKPGEPGKALVKALEGHIDPYFWGFDMDYPDQKRADRFIQELKRFEREGEMPRLTILRLPNDHTAGATVGKRTPTAYVADNDLALGRVVDAISHSKFWKETAIFVVEDDAQNGSDHVDAHRTIALVVSPYTRRGQVDSSMYSTNSMLRTIELILGLKPMSQFDAAARPMFASFQARPDERPYTHVMPNVDLNERNQASAWGAKLSEQFDLSKEDAADDLLLNEVIWRSVKGAGSPMPPPVRSAFVFPRLKEK